MNRNIGRSVTRHAGAVLYAAVAVLALTGCEQMFTYTPVAFLQTPASAMTPAQQVAFGQDALASGDKTKMAEAYTALSANTGSADAQYTAAQLGVELSGVPELVLDIAGGSVTMPASGDSAALTDFITAHNLDPDILIAAAANLENAQTLGQTLAPIDYVMGGLGLALDAAQQPDGTFNFGALDAAKQTETIDFITQTAVTDLLSTLPPTDPTYQILQGFQDYINSIV
jgi:hypothetical protein